MGWRVGSSERALHQGDEKSERISSGMVVIEVVMSVFCPGWWGSQLF